MNTAVAPIAKPSNIVTMKLDITFSKTLFHENGKKEFVDLMMP
jgi:hypothetical protein